MELQLATIKDIMEELQSRNMRFVFIGTENTNSNRKDAVCFAAQAASKSDLLSLIKAGEDASMKLDDDD